MGEEVKERTSQLEAFMGPDVKYWILDSDEEIFVRLTVE
jgi:hypothetical protein